MLFSAMSRPRKTKQETLGSLRERRPSMISFVTTTGFEQLRPYATAIARWKPQRQRQWFELYASWRGIVELSGFFGDRGPYPGSLFARDSDSAEKEFHQALEFGVLVDQRNNETRPTSGWLVGAFTRNALLLGGGAKTYSGATLTLADYRRLGTSLGLSNWVLANRVILDVMTGDVPVRELSRVGGLWRTTAFGGTIGRGIRADRFSGKFKLVSQTELRTGGVPLFGSVKLGAQLFADVGWVGKTLTNFGGRPDSAPLRISASVPHFFGVEALSPD